MSDNRVTFNTINSTVNWMFLIFVFLQVLFFSTYYFELPENILAHYKQILHVVSWSIGILCILIFIYSFSLFFTGDDYPVKENIWNIIRTIITFVLITITNTLEKIVENPIHVNI